MVRAVQAAESAELGKQSRPSAAGHLLQGAMKVNGFMRSTMRITMREKKARM